MSEHLNMNNEPQSTSQNSSETAEKSFLIIGLEPALIDFSDANYAAFPGLDSAKALAGHTAEQKRLKALGCDVHLCLTDFGQTAETVVIAQLKTDAVRRHHDWCGRSNSPKQLHSVRETN